ncbi:MAG: hypothetical protein EBS07_08945 [Sphingobacteriia bacterium]|nr:hypothetical protein [Sphingobacteriia bacterium]
MRTVAEYIQSYPNSIQAKLFEIRDIILEAAPNTEERIGYGMPGVFLDGFLVYYGAFKHHIGLYPGSEAIQKFTKELEGFNSSKGAVQFPYEKPLPKQVIQEIVKYRLYQQLNKKAK